VFRRRVRPRNVAIASVTSIVLLAVVGMVALSLARCSQPDESYFRDNRARFDAAVPLAMRQPPTDVISPGVEWWARLPRGYEDLSVLGKVLVMRHGDSHLVRFFRFAAPVGPARTFVYSSDDSPPDQTATPLADKWYYVLEE
jgi:hypothetical protein